MVDLFKVFQLHIPYSFVCQRGIKSRAQQRRVEGLGEIVGRTHLYAAKDTLHFIQRGYHDDRYVSLHGVLLHALEHPEAVQLGHHQVQQHDVERLAAEQVQGLPPILRHGDVVALLLSSSWKARGD